MPTGLPPGTAPTGRDWPVLLSKWTLVLALTVAALTGLVLAIDDEGPIPGLVLWCLGSSLAAVAAIVVLGLAWNDGGWDRLRRTPFWRSRTEEEKVEDLRASSPFYRGLVLVGSVLALGGAMAVLVIPARPNLKAAVKLGVAGSFGLWRWYRSRPKG